MVITVRRFAFLLCLLLSSMLHVKRSWDSYHWRQAKFSLHKSKSVPCKMLHVWIVLFLDNVFVNTFTVLFGRLCVFNDSAFLRWNDPKITKLNSFMLRSESISSFSSRHMQHREFDIKSDYVCPIKYRTIHFLEMILCLKTNFVNICLFAFTSVRWYRHCALSKVLFAILLQKCFSCSYSINYLW